MAGRRSRDEGDHVLASGLRNPYPSAPHRLPTHGFHIRCRGRSFSTNFSACYAAKHFFNLVVDGEEYKRLSSTKIKTSGGVYLESPELEEILSYKFSSPEEKRWDIPGHYRWQSFYVATGRRLNLRRPKSYEQIGPYSQEIRRATSPEISEGSRSFPTDRSHSPIPRMGGNVDRRPSSGDTGRSVREKRSDRVSLQEICDEIGMETSRARRILRARSDLSHARQGRWEWDERDALEIKKILEKSK